MKKQKLSLFFCLVLLFPGAYISQMLKGPTAKFSFNNGRTDDEITHRKAKPVGVIFAKDRFGNSNNAVYLLGSQSSYINLGNYQAIKPVIGSISLWVNIELEIHAGKGYKSNPILLTKAHSGDDFYESYSFQYAYEAHKINCACTLDSLKQIIITPSEKITRYAWHHLVMTYDSAWLCFYIDNNLESCIRKGFQNAFLKTDSVVVGISANKKNDRFFNGSVDDIEFYDYVLSEKEVNDLFHAPNPNRHKIQLYWIAGFLLFACIIILIYVFLKRQLNLTLKKERDRLEINNKMLEMELRVNRALMDPHFIFNSLNALQNYILKNKVEGAVDYLARFSRLIRKMLEGNMSNIIPLSVEIELIDGYLEIENLRFKEKMAYFITIDPKIIPLAVKIPVMMLQPFIENSIWHGLQRKEKDREIRISFSLHDEKYVKAVIEDNGTGRRPKVESSSERKSLAINFVQQRLDLLNRIHNLDCSLAIIDKPNSQGTIVTIILPIYKDH